MFGRKLSDKSRALAARALCLTLWAAVSITALGQQPEPDQRSRLRVSQTGASESAQPAAGAGAKKRAKGATDHVTNQGSGGAALSYRVEIGDKAPTADNKVSEMTVPLTVTKSTRFVCPEKPLNLIFGVDPKANFIIDESTEETERNNRYEFYLSPLRTGVQTNLWIEMKSGTVPVRLETVPQREGASFVGEVLVRLPGYRDEMARLRSRVGELEGELTASAKAAQQRLSAADERAEKAEADSSMRSMQTGFALLTAAADPEAVRSARKEKLAAGEFGGLRVSQLSRAYRDPFDRWWVLVRLEAKQQKGKQPPGAIIERIEVKDGRTVRASAALPYVVGAQQHGADTLALVIDAGGGAGKNAPGLLTVFLTGGGSLSLSLAR
jgi:hypothetical protein